MEGGKLQHSSRYFAVLGEDPGQNRFQWLVVATDEVVALALLTAAIVVVGYGAGLF